MNVDEMKPGLKVRVAVLGGTIGMFIAQKNLTKRREGVTGIVYGFVPGHGGDVWFVQHDACDEIAPYMPSELERV